MPIPSNITALTAIDMGTLPYSNTQRVDSGGTTYTVWYSYTPPTGVVEIGIWAFGDLSVYKPTLSVYTGPASAPVNIFPLTLAENIPVQVPVVAGTPIYFKIEPNGGNPTPANLAVSAILGPDESIPAGSIVVPDDVSDYGTAFLSPTTNYTVLGFNTAILSCEAGDTLDDGTILTDDTNTDDFNLYDASFNRTVISYTAVGSVANIRTCKGAQNFYFGDPGDSGVVTHASLHKVSSAGVISTVAADIGVYGLLACAASNDETLVYLSTAVSGAVKKWNVGGAAFTTDLIAGISGYKVFDILVLSDDTIVVGWVKNGSPFDLIVKVIQPDGTVSHTVTPPSDNGTGPHLAYALDDPDSYWVWVHLTSPVGQDDFINYSASSTTATTTLLTVEFEKGMYVEAPTATPVARFGNSNSCPFFILNALIPPTGDRSGIYHIAIGKTHDELFHGAVTDPTEDVKIPNPTARMFPLGE